MEDLIVIGNPSNDSLEQRLADLLSLSVFGKTLTHLSSARTQLWSYRSVFKLSTCALQSLYFKELEYLRTSISSIPSF